jgi:hypothetical protein
MVGLIVAMISELINVAKDGGADRDAPQLSGAVRPQHGGTYQGGYYWPAAQPQPKPRSVTGIVGTVALVLVLIGGGFGLAYGAQSLGHRAIDFLDEQATPPWEKKTQDPGRERIAKAVSRTKGALTISVSSVRVNEQATIVTMTAGNTGKDSLNLPVYSNALLDVDGANTFNADPAAGTFGGTVPARGKATGTIVFDGVLEPGAAHVTLSFAHIFGSLNGPDNIAVVIPIAAGS